MDEGQLTAVTMRLDDLVNVLVEILERLSPREVTDGDSEVSEVLEGERGSS